MNSELSGIWEHMRELGLCALAHANRHSIYYDMNNGAWSELAVLQAAHAAEILFKARIAQEHPLLIFEDFPKPSSSEITIEALFDKGKSIEWTDIPTRLWAATGISIPQVELFRKFGKLRNGIQHFAPAPNIDVTSETLNFIYGVIDPFINQTWGLFAIDYDEDDEPYIYSTPTLVCREIPFLVSPDAAKCFDDWDVDWEQISPQYHKMISERVAQALATEEKTD
ncbi:MAG: hypothetical protein ACI4KC_09415 [Gemmiger sp.]